MHIWFDISNSPQVLLFKDMLLDLQKQGHTVIVTSRPLANTIELLDNEKIAHYVIGKHYGKKLWSKVFGYPIRVLQLWNFLRTRHVDLSVAQSSFHAPLVARMLGIKSIYTNDNEHAKGNIPAFLFASTILLPKGFSIKGSLLSPLIAHKICFYPGVKEGIYLSRKYAKASIPLAPRNGNKLHIYIRPEPSTAQYYKGKENFLDDLILQAKSIHQITVLPRNELQRLHYTGKQFNGIDMPKTVLSFDEIAKDCSLFIGAGGSMTREMALIGIPTVSVYQDKLLAVDQQLIDKKYLTYKPTIDLSDLNELIVPPSFTKNEFMIEGLKAYQLFIDTINNYDTIWRRKKSDSLA